MLMQEDISTARRYQMDDMVIVCENMLIVNESNWTDIYKAALKSKSLRLQLEVKLFLRDHLSLLTKETRSTTVFIIINNNNHNTDGTYMIL